MSQITHLTTLPKNIDYWDYYILCRCDDAASKVLQRMEYWDGTKVGGNVHNEKDNDQAIESGNTPTQDTSRFVYKTREELAWEMIGSVKERSAYKALDDIINLKYLKSRHNPYKTFDRTLQYEFQYELVKEHLNKLYFIVQCFTEHKRQMRPVLYAIERLTEEGVFINRIEQEGSTADGKDTLSIALVADRLSLMHKQMHLDEEEGKKKLAEGEKKHKPLLPTFIKLDLKKDELQGFSEAFPLCKNAQCIHTFLHNASGQKCTMDCAKKHSGLCKFARAIPVITTEITNNDYNTDCNIDDTANADVSTTSQNPLSEKNEEENTTSPTTSQEQQTTTPTSKGNAPRRSAAGKGKQSKKDEIEQMLKLSEIAAPKKPDPATHPYNVELFMELGDYYRGCQLPKSNQPNSRYQKALKSSMNYVQRKTPFRQVDMVFCYVLDRGDEIGLPGLKDEKWIKGGYNTDLWTIEPYHASKWAECQKEERKILASLGGKAPSTSNPVPGMNHDEAIQLAAYAMTQGKEHGYNIQANATSTKTGSWVVKVLWGDDGKLTIKSRQHWQSEFAEIHETYVTEQQKGVN